MEQKGDSAFLPESILRVIPEGLILLDRKWIITFLNPTAEEMTGCSIKEAIGKNLSSIIAFADNYTKLNIKIPLPRNTFKNHEPVIFWNTTVKKRDDKTAIIDATFSPIPGTRDSINGYILIIKDASSRLAIDEELIAKLKIETIANMAGSLAHDFANSLGIISGHASAIADNLIPTTRAHEEALRILEATKHVGNLSKHLSSLARIGGTKTDMHVESVNLGNMVLDAINIMEESFSTHHVSFKVRNPESMPYVMADERQLLDCIINILLNATEAMQEGGTVTIDAEETSLQKISFVILRIRDSGKGMPREVLDRVFEPFYTTKPAGSGTGLGLSVVRSSIERWGGMIKIRSRPAAGTSVRLFLRKAKTQLTKESAREIKDRKETILVIDDTAPLLDKTVHTLKEVGYNIYSASSGDEGLVIYGKNADEIDLIVIDFFMPGMNGKKVLEEILASDPNASIIMMSGFSRDYVRAMLQRGAWGFIQKPFTPEHLISAVRKMLDHDTAMAKVESFQT